MSQEKPQAIVVINTMCVFAMDYLCLVNQPTRMVT